MLRHTISTQVEETVYEPIYGTTDDVCDRRRSRYDGEQANPLAVVVILVIVCAMVVVGAILSILLFRATLCFAWGAV